MEAGTLDTRGEWLNTRDGVTAPSTPGGRGGFLTDVIVELGLASETAVANALEEARFAGRQPGALLVEQGALTSNDLARAIAERNGFPHVDLEEFEVDDDATQLIDRNAAMRYCALPIAFTPGGTLVVALADPIDAIAVSDIAVITKTDLLPVVAAADALMARIEHLPDAPRHVAPQLPAAPTAPPPAAPPSSTDSPVPAAVPATSVPSGPPVVADGALDELSGEIESLRAELDREREARAAAERERDDERARAAETIQALSDGADGELEKLRVELERERGEATARIAIDTTGKDELRDEIEKLKGELESERGARAEREHGQATEARRNGENGPGETEALRAEASELLGRLEDESVKRAEGERLLDGEHARHAETARALEQAGSEKEELRLRLELELERERAARTELERQQDTDRVQHAQTTDALAEAGNEIERLRSRIDDLSKKRDRDREAREVATRRLQERGANVACAGDEIQRALEGLDDATRAARSVAARLATEPSDRNGDLRT